MKKNRSHKHTVELFKKEILGFCEHLKILNYSARTTDHYHANLQLFFNWLWRRGVDDLREVTKQILKDYQQYVKTYEHKPGYLYTPNTVMIKLSSVKRLFDYLEKTNQVLYNPAVVIRLEKKTEDRIPRNILTQAEAKKILDQPDPSDKIGLRDRTILEVLYSTGIRLEELSNLTIYDVDYKSGFLRVNHGKFAKDRVLPLTRICCRYLKEYIRYVRPKLLQDNKDERKLFIGKYKIPMKKQAIQVRVREIARQAGITKKSSPHVWRHTFASHLVANGANMLHVQKLLGHVSSKTTQLYTKVNPSESKETQTKHHPREKEKCERIKKPKKGLPCIGKRNKKKRKKI